MERSVLLGSLALAIGCGASAGTHGGLGGQAAGIGGAAAGVGGGAGFASEAGGAAGGSGGSGAGGSTTCTPGPATSTGSVLERNNHPSRDGNFLQPQLTKCALANAATTQDAAFAANFDGSMWASPLYAQNGPAGKGVFYAVTTSNTVYALDEADGHTVWTTSIGSSPTANQTGNVTCGNIHPLGILSTPVIDATARRIYVAGAIGTTSILRHEVHALSLDTGEDAVTGGWPVNVSGLSAGSLAFAAATAYQNQRSALSLVGGKLYVAYGGHIGDCGPYHGWVVGIDTTATPVATGAWATGGQGEAIWAAGGMASDGVGVFAMTGNSTVGINPHADSEELVRVTGLGAVNRTSSADVFYPAIWNQMDASDLDLGSNNPMYLEVPGATPATYVVALSKDGHMYLVDSTNLGGMGGQVVDFAVASSGMSLHTAPAAYKTAAGVHVVFSTDSGAICPAGMPSGKVIMSVVIPAGAPPVPRVVWCAALGGPVTSPIVTTSDGTNDAIVWYLNSGTLTGLDGDTGATIYASTDTCSGVRQWTSPIAVNGRVVTGGDGHLCAWTVH